MGQKSKKGQASAELEKKWPSSTFRAETHNKTHTQTLQDICRNCSPMRKPRLGEKMICPKLTPVGRRKTKDGTEFVLPHCWRSFHLCCCTTAVSTNSTRPLLWAVVRVRKRGPSPQTHISQGINPHTGQEIRPEKGLHRGLWKLENSRLCPIR